MIEQVKSKMTEAFHHFNKKDGIRMDSIRIKIVKNDSLLGFTLMNKTDKVRDTDLSEMIGVMASMLAKGELYKSVEKLINENGLDEKEACVKIYPAENLSPLVHLFNNGKALKSVEIEKLLN